MGFAASQSRACELARQSQASYYYRNRRRDPAGLRLRMRELPQARMHFGYQRIQVLLCREGWRVNFKRVRRLYRLDGLPLRFRARRRKHASLHRGLPPAASQAHERWSIDFVHCTLADGRRFRGLTVVDLWSRLSPILQVAPSVSDHGVAKGLNRAIAPHGQPATFTVEHGTAFTSRAMDEWACKRGVRLDLIRPECRSKTASSSRSTFDCATNL